jgi:SAM-dependent methyltransferase
MKMDQEKLNALIEKAVSELAAGYGGVMMSLGSKLGLYKAMDGQGPLSAKEVAERAGCNERYVREWLNSQAAGGFLLYHPSSECYELTPEQAYLLADEASPVYMPPAWEVPASMWFDEDKALEAFKTGKGVPWGDHDDRLFCGVAAFYANAYRGELVQQWLPALDGVQEKLSRGASVADVGCGHGHSTVIMAEAYPNSRFVGFDAHEDSLLQAQRLAQEKGVADRVDFRLSKAKKLPNDGYDLLCYFDCLHDMGDPVGAAEQAREVVAEDGTVMLVEPFANDRVEDNLNPVGRIYYSASATICCAHSLSEEKGAALGAQAGERRLADVFQKAGFSSFRRAAETPFNLILEAKP